MTHLHVSTALFGLLGGYALWGGSGGAGYAQINADSTLGAEPSVVNMGTSGGADYFVSGGALRGPNLFHSFDEFSLPTGSTVQFLNSSVIENIISRVTGTQISRLDGKISALGDSNFFLINPNGIVITPNAALDIGGSFLASTGSGLRFSNDFIYDVEATTQPPLLSITSPLGITFGSAPGTIQVSGHLGEVNALSSGLSVPLGQTLALLGREVSISNAQLDAPGGRIEIGGVAESSEIDITPLQQGFDFSFDQLSRLGDIQISGQSIVDASGPGGGAIELQGQTIAMSEGSALLSDTLGAVDGQKIVVIADRFSLEDSSYIGAATQGDGASSQIEVNATQDFVINGTGIINFKLLQFSILLGNRQVSDREVGGLFTTTTGAGKTGDITVSANNIFMDEGTVVSTSSLGTGSSGDIGIFASDKIKINGSGILTNSLSSGIALITPEGAASGLTTAGLTAGMAGNIQVETAQLLLEDGGAIASATVSDQDSGDVKIIATESILLKGFFDALPIPTSITAVTVGGEGNAGDIDIETSRLTLQDGSQIFTNSGSAAFVGFIPFGGQAGNLRIQASEFIDIGGGKRLGGFVLTSLESETYSHNPAGAIRLDTPRLTLRDGGRITSATFGDGNGGTIEINADEILVSGSGRGENDFFGGGILSSSGTDARSRLISGQVVSLPANGAGGSITIQAKDLRVQNDAELTVSSFGTGTAGDLNITTDSIYLDSQGQLLASTTSREGGDIKLRVKNELLLRQNSRISAQAAASGDGGNIDIEAGLIATISSENSDIVADAVEGQGGNIQLTANNILGFQESNSLTPQSDISASSEVGIDGSVTINSPESEIDSTQIELSETFAPPELEASCHTIQTAGSSFVQTGRGGLPINPVSPVSTDSLWQDLEPLPSASLRSQQIALSPISTASQNKPVIKSKLLKGAIAWRLTNNGDIELVASEDEGKLSLSLAATCYSSR